MEKEKHYGRFLQRTAALCEVSKQQSLAVRKEDKVKARRQDRLTAQLRIKAEWGEVPSKVPMKDSRKGAQLTW